MDWTAALTAAGGLLTAATAIGFAGRARSGRLRRADAPSTPGPTAADLLGLPQHDRGGAATLVQFSTEFCSRCPATARQLAALAADYDGVRRVEVDLTGDAATADRFRIMETPTTLVLDDRGAVVARLGGVPRLSELRDLLDTLTRSHRVR